MGNTVIQTNLVTLGASAGLNDDMDGFVETFKTLLQAYVPGLPNFYKGLRPIESEDINLDCVMVQPLADQSEMRTTAKFHTFWPFDFYWVVGEDTVDACTVKATNCAMIFRKLFSNNALNDQGTAGATNKFKKYEPNWTNSEMTEGVIGVPVLSNRPSGPKYFAAGYFKITLETQKLV